ncbi:MAG: DUF5615 family PIN-like protein [Candidatus Levybacteria bacterium]|nr:DUF5615 family PIN-like protein [Candidatus Levybacteria bacterium]
MSIKSSKRKITHPKKFRLLLDTAFASVSAFPHLAKKANVKNAYFDLRMPKQCSDEEIYQKAIENDRFVVTINFDDFSKLVKKDKPGIIGIPSQLTNADIDAVLTKFVSIN